MSDLLFALVQCIKQLIDNLCQIGSIGVLAYIEATADGCITRDLNQLVAERAAQGIVPLPLNVGQVAELVELVELVQNLLSGRESEVLDLLENRIPPGVDESAYVKATFLASVTRGEVTSPILTPIRAAELLGAMQGGYNIAALVEAVERRVFTSVKPDCVHLVVSLLVHCS